MTIQPKCIWPTVVHQGRGMHDATCGGASAAPTNSRKAQHRQHAAPMKLVKLDTFGSLDQWNNGSWRPVQVDRGAGTALWHIWRPKAICWEVELFRKFNRVMKCHEWSLSLARSLHTLWTRTTHQVSGTPFAFAKVAVFTIMYCEIRYDTILYFTTLCHTCTMLYYTILCYTMLYHTMLCYAVLFYTMLYRYCTILLFIVLLRSIWLRTCVLHTWILDIPWCTRRNDLGSTRDHVLGLWSNGYPFWTPVRYPQLLRLIHKFGLQRSWSPWARKNLRNQGIFKAKSHRLVLPCLSTVNAS